jgi:hypothetical protein
MTRKKVTLTQDQKIKVLLIEMDYHLMGLFDAMGAKDTRAVTSEKRLLRQIHGQLEELGYFPSPSEAEGI